ncbi:hypothetical protein F4802DRAFT_613519 [Xylaria palmicola]|nr:hypothetical protein F4802DRAFT_613519 [Xylaria palmicola]
MISAPPPYQQPANKQEPSQTEEPALPPPYTEHAGADQYENDVELASLSRSTSASSHAPTTTAAEASSSSSSSSSSPHHSFTATRQLQIQTPGKNLISLPTPQPADPIPIFALAPDGRRPEPRPLYLSVRPDPRSGSCFLTRGDDDHDGEARAPLTTTTYRFGPGRPPVVVLGDPAIPTTAAGEAGIEGVSFEIRGRGPFSRAVRFEVPGVGSFGWRHGSRAERTAAGADDVDSLLVCEVFQQPGDHGGVSALISGHRRKNGEEEGEGEAEKEKGGVAAPRRIAQLVRSEALRTPGSSRSSAGNGGRLLLDLSPFDEKRRERVEWLVVTTAITMLKREVDRRRAQQIAVLGAIVA